LGCSVIAQEAFPQVVQNVVNSVLDRVADDPKLDSLLVPAGCASGYHRAEVTTSVAADLLNVLQFSDGSKLFECQVFSMSQANSKHEARALLDRAWDWSRSDPWVAIPIPESIFGEEASRKDRQASANMDALFAFRQQLVDWVAKVEDTTASDKSPSPSEVPSRSPSPADWPPPPPAPSCAPAVERKRSATAQSTDEGVVARLQKRGRWGSAVQPVSPPAGPAIPIFEVAYENDMWLSIPSALSQEFYDKYLTGADATYTWQKRSYVLDFVTMVQRNIANDRRRSVRLIWVCPEEVTPFWTGQVPKS
jgi:hypothetical protein